MSNENEIEDEALGRWLAGEMSAEEQKAFEASNAFQTYQAIAQYSENLEALAYDVESELQRLQTTVKSVQDKPAVIKMPVFKRLAIAAGFVLLIGVSLFVLFNKLGSLDRTEVMTAEGETKSILLPDESEVSLNIASNIEYSKKNWEKERTVSLSGEAYFKVKKGSKFSVTTEHGKVEVLGTEFNVRNRQGITEVVCFEGKVKVTDLKKESTILLPGDAVRIYDGTIEQDWTPLVSDDADWKNGSSSFHDAPLTNVLEELENQYKISVDCKADINERTYVGIFPHDNLEQALQMVCGPMQLNYTIKGDTMIVIE